MELTDRELALRWWNRKSIQERTELAKQAKFTVENRDFNTLTGNEIEWIWRNRIWRNQPYHLLAEVTPRQKFVSEMQSIISKLDAIDRETPWQHGEPEWWLGMMDIRKKAFDAVQKFSSF